MKRSVQQKITASAIVFLALSAGRIPKAQAMPRWNRRGVLGLGLFSLFSRATKSTTQIPIPSPPANFATSAARVLPPVRGEALVGLLKKLDVRWDKSFFGEAAKWELSELDRLIIADWRAKDPAKRGFIDRDIREYERVVAECNLLPARRIERDPVTNRYAFEQRLRGDDEAKSERVKASRDALRAKVTEWPWSTFDWTTVFGDAIHAAEAVVVRDLAGEFNEAQVHVLTEHAVRPVDGHVATLAGETFVPPVWNEDKAEILARAFDPVLPPLARHIRMRSVMTPGERASLQQRVTEAAFGQKTVIYVEWKRSPLRFLFYHHKEKCPTAEVLAPDYLKTRATLVLMHERAKKLVPSAVRDALIQATRVTIEQLEMELESLAPRLEAFAATLAAQDDEERAVYGNGFGEGREEDPTWASYSDLPIDAASVVHWHTFLKTTADRLQMASSPERATLKGPATCPSLLVDSSLKVEPAILQIEKQNTPPLKTSEPLQPPDFDPVPAKNTPQKDP